MIEQEKEDPQTDRNEKPGVARDVINKILHWLSGVKMSQFHLLLVTLMGEFDKFCRMRGSQESRLGAIPLEIAKAGASGRSPVKLTPLILATDFRVWFAMEQTATATPAVTGNL